MVDKNALKPLCVLDVKGLVDSKLGAQGGHLLVLEFIVARGIFGAGLGSALALGAGHDLLGHHLVNDVAGSQFHQAEHREAQQKKQGQHRHKTARDEFRKRRNGAHPFPVLFPYTGKGY